MRPAGGFAVIRRSLWEHPAFRNKAEAGIFAWMISQAAWRPTRVHYKGKAIILQRGQLAISLRDLAHNFEQSIGWIQRFINRVKIDSMVETATDSGVMVITICNYSKYQDLPSEADSPSDSPSDSKTIQKRDTEQQSKPIKQDSLTKRTHLPADWKPPPVADLTPEAKNRAKQWPRGAYADTAEDFKTWWQSEGRMKADWDATWRNWITKSHARIMRAAKYQRPGEGKKLYQVLNEQRERV
jgi:hypothetical protein